MLNPTHKTLWMSATLPRVAQLPTLVNNFREKFKITDEKQPEHVSEAFSAQLDRGVLLVRPSGAIAFLHDGVSSAEDLTKLCQRLPGDPLVLKSYTERALSR